jgi:hypothetical protein
MMHHEMIRERSMTNEEYRAIRNALHPELRGHLKKNGWLHHPLVVQPMLTLEDAAFINETYPRKLKGLEQARAERNWWQYLSIYQKPYRLEAFAGIHDEMDHQTYWHLLSATWQMSENIWQWRSVWQHFWNSGRPMKRAAMNEDEQRHFDGLPDLITIYRGQSQRNQRGMSWSLDRQRAEWFAARQLIFNGCHDVAWLLTATVRKRDAHAYLNGSTEHEIVADKYQVMSRERLSADYLEVVQRQMQQKRTAEAHADHGIGNRSST